MHLEPVLLWNTSINRNILECKAFSVGWKNRKQPGINRNILECKGIPLRSLHPLLFCINRNILECKDGRKYDNLSLYYRINRNILECKARYGTDVNAKTTVLIETYWNVKGIGKEYYDSHASINRNILECKGGCSAFFKAFT